MPGCAWDLDEECCDCVLGVIWLVVQRCDCVLGVRWPSAQRCDLIVEWSLAQKISPFEISYTSVESDVFQGGGETKDTIQVPLSDPL
jgi:hypothetical protein